MRYLAIDFGTRRIGLAVGDDDVKLASPLATVTRSRSLPHDLGEIVRFAEKEKVEAIVVGLPLHADGSESKSSQLAGEFSRALGKRVKMPIHLHDEFLSSADAEEELLALDVSRKKRKEVLDQLAAVHILESYFRSTPPAPSNAPLTPSNGGIL